MFDSYFFRRLRSHLQVLVPAWMCAVLDPRNEISSAATEGLRNTIPQAKHADTINFVRSGILTHVEDHISTLFDYHGKLLSKEPSADEESETFSRVCTTNVKLLAHLSEIISPEDFTKISSKFTQLLDSHIWRMLKAVDPKIRASVYSLTASLLRHQDYCTPRLEDLANILLNSLTDAHAEVQPTAWAGALTLISSYPLLSYPWMTTKKLLAPLVQSLKSPLATVATYQSLLPLLSKLPLEGFQPEFVNTLFPELWRAIKNDTMAESVVTTYLECLLFVIAKVQAEQQSSILETHFLPIFSGYFAYEKDLASNIAHDVALFITRLESKPALRHLAQESWKKAETISQDFFLLSSTTTEQKPAKSGEEASAAIFSTKLTQFLVEYHSIKADSGFLANFLEKMLEPALVTLYDRGLVAQLQLIAKIGTIWRSMAQLSMTQERKKAEAVEFLANHANAPSYISDLAISPLKSSLSKSIDNTEWRSLLHGLVQQKDTRAIESFMTQDVNDSYFWRCSDLDSLALSQANFHDISIADEGNAKYKFILPSLIPYLSDATLIQICPTILSIATSSKSKWNKAFVENIVATVGAVCCALANIATDVTLMLNLAFDWCLITDHSLESSLATLLKQKALQMLERALQEMGDCDTLNCSHLVSLVRSQLSEMMNTATVVTDSQHQAIEYMADLVGRMVSAMSGNLPPHICLDLVSRVLLTEDEWVFALTAISSQRKSDAFHHGLLSDHSQTASQSSAAIASESVLRSALMLLEYTVLTFSKIPNIERTVSDVALNSPQVDSSRFTGSHCDVRIVSQISRLLTCQETLSLPPSAHRDAAVTEDVRRLELQLSSLLNDIIFPRLVLQTPSFAYQLSMHAIANYATTGLASAQLDALLSFIASTSAVNDDAKKVLLTNLWNHIFASNTKHAALIATFQSSAWLNFVDEKQLSLASSRALSELYALKPSGDGSIANINDDKGYHFLVASSIMPILGTKVDSRKIMEIFTFASKAAFSIIKSDSPSRCAQPTFIVGLSVFLARVLLNSKMGLSLTEANYAVVFDLGERLLPLTQAAEADSITSEANAVMMLLDAICEHVSSLGTSNEDWAAFVNAAIGPLCVSWKNIVTSLETWPESYLGRWAKVMRFVPNSAVLRLDGESVTSLYGILRSSTNIQVQITTFPMLLNVIREHNANTFTKILSRSDCEHLASIASKSNNIGPEVLDSAILPDALQNLVTDIEAGYFEPLGLDEIDTSSSGDIHVFCASNSLCASTLFGWRLLLEYMNSKDEKERNDVSAWIRLSGLTPVLVPLLCDIIDISRPPKIPSDTLLERHLYNIGFDASSPSALLKSTSETIRALSFYLLRDLFELVPAIIRSWWQNAKPVLQSETEAFAAKYISPQLIARELARVSSWKASSSSAMDDFSMKAATIGEVVATYTKDEVELQLTLKINAAHPLRPITVTMSHIKAVSEPLWRKWLLSMRTLLLTKDGTLLDAVLLWRNYLDQHFDGVECCPICYAIFQISDYSLPDLACKTCRNKFHRACLYKWFNSSHHNECPLCKTPFN